MSLRSVRIAGAVWLVAAAAVARPVNERRPVDPDALVTIKNINGSISVEGWDQKEVEITGTITGDIEGVDISGTASRLKIEVEYPRGMRGARGEADLDVKVPVGAGVRVSVVNAGVTVSKLEGEIEIEAVNGDIAVTGKPARVEAQSVNGTIEITATSGVVVAETVGGRIRIEGPAGDIAASTVGGSILVAGGKFERAKFSAVSGDIDFAGELGGKGTFEAESHSGDVILRLPAEVSAEFEVHTFSGDIDNDFGPSGSRRGYGPGRELSFTAGKGDASVTINTFSGDVRLVKK